MRQDVENIPHLEEIGNGKAEDQRPGQDREYDNSVLHTRPILRQRPVRADGDSGAFILPQTLNNSRTNELGVSVDLSRGLRLLAGDSSGVGRAVARLRPVDMSTRLTRTSTYDLSAFDPDLSYQLALGGLDRFQQQEGSAALGVSEARTATITSGADLPYGFAFNISQALTRTTRLQRVSDRFIETETTQHEWPVGSLRWTRAFSKGPLTLVALGTAVRRRDGNSVQANRDGPAALTAIESFSITPDLQIGLRNGMSVTLALTSLDQSNRSNGNETQLDQSDVTGAFNYTFRLPLSVSRKRQQVRSSMTFVSTIAKTCLDQSDGSACTVISDVRRREIRGGLDTDLLHTLTGGLQVGYSLNDARHLSRRTSQISIIASFQLSLFGGDYQVAPAIPHSECACAA